jgi:hypothetical protein
VARLGLGDIPTPIFILKELNFGFGWPNTHALADVPRNGNLAFAGDAHDDLR